MSDHQRDREKKLLKPHAQETEGGGDDTSSGIDVSLLERRLEGLRDTQESVQGLSLWCQANKRHSTVIIETWLRILRKSPVEKRLTLFYLANDVVQHAKKKNDMSVVNQWAFAVQKATPHVRTPSSVSAAISRIFKIWEERSIYSKDAIADLLSLLNNVPAKDRVVESSKPETYTASAEKVSAFQSPSLISKSKLAYRLKSHLGVTFRTKKYVDMEMDTFKTMIKDRSQGLEIISEVAQFLEQLKASEAKLSGEVDERRKIVETSEIGLVFYENLRGEAKIVNAAYKNFTTRVTSTDDKVAEKLRSFEEMEGTISPVPSPPHNAPSPPPDEEDFGVRPADKCGGSYMSTLPTAAASYIEVIQNNTKEIPTEPISSRETAGPSSAASRPYTPTNIINSPIVSTFDANQAYQAITSMQQQLQSWSSSGMVDSYASTSMTIPNLNFMQQFQQPNMPIMSTGYGGMQMQPPSLHQAPYANIGYETYQRTNQSELVQGNPPLPPQDLSAIPLPPGPNPPQPPPPLPQEAPPPEQANMYAPPGQPPPPPVNPFEAEYDPVYPQHSSFAGEATGYDPIVHQYNSQQNTPPAEMTQQGRYHPYKNSQSLRGRRLSGPNRSQNHASRYQNNNTSPTNATAGSQIPPLIPELSPMERFSQSLSKNRSNSTSGMNNTTLPESPASSTGDWPALNKDEGAVQSSYVQSQNQNPYYNINSSFSDYDDSQIGHSDGVNGSKGTPDPYIPTQGNNIFDTGLPSQSNNQGGGIHLNHRGGGGMRGMKQHSIGGMNVRGHPRGGGIRGGIQNSRGFSPGFRGTRGGINRGAGPPRGGGRGRF